uniref:RPA1 related single stranded DNA binding protein, X-linked n=1 Tax=Phasianus colchicus TaxID=9054 RepID=A0A669QP42_PHACC
MAGKEPDPARPAEESPGGVAAGGGPPGEEASWLRRLAEEARSGWRLSAAPSEPPALTVAAVERYLAEAPPAAPRYWYDVTLADGAGQERCYLAPRLSRLVQRAHLHPGARVRLTRCSYLYDERRLRRGLLCIEELQPAAHPASPPPPAAARSLGRGPPPLRGERRHYLPLWNNEDPYGDMWCPIVNAFCFLFLMAVSKLISLGQLETTWRSRIHFRPLLVRVLHKSRLRYYGKPEKKMDMPYQAYFEVADGSGMMSMVLWNSLCPEWYNSINVGTVLLLEQYAVKDSYPFKTQPTPRDSQMKRFTTIEISLNVRNPPTKISIISEEMVKPEWGLPEVKYRFVTRTELNDLPNNHSCDVIGLVTFVGRVERTRKKEDSEDFWLYRWAHAIDGTSDKPFILEIFATSQPDVFERIHPMTYLVCTQMRVVRDLSENPSHTVYLTTSNESQIFITGWHKGQPYTKDTKVKNFIQWTRTQSEANQMRKTVIGGYYPFPRPPNNFLKYCKNNKVESVLKAIGELGEEIEGLHYREHKRIAIQGIISAIRYISCSSAAEDASGVEPVQLSSVLQWWMHCGTQSLLSLVWIQRRILQNPTNYQSEWEFQIQKINDAPETEEMTRTCSSWQSDLWAQVKDKLMKYLHHSMIFPESIPCKFDYMYKDLLMQQYNLHAAVHQPKETRIDKNISEFKNTGGFGYYEVTVLGINHDVAIDVAFLPVFGHEDPHLFPVEEVENDPLLSCMSCISSCQQATDEIVKAAMDLDSKHVVCILDVCHLGDDKVEVFLSKIYKTVEADVPDPV